MAKIKCFLLVETGVDQLFLRRYSTGSCNLVHGYHDAMVPVGQQVRAKNAVTEDAYPHDDSRWPKHCGCGYEFQAEDRWQLFRRSIYRREDNREAMTIEEAPVGAMWFADWYGEHFRGPDGHSLMVKTPGGDWLVDGRASNCTMPEDHSHRCWVRHGAPPDVTVDKNGNTCGAGAGSIRAGNYHGFLRGGYLVD